MIFNSYDFIIIFFPVTILVYYLLYRFNPNIRIAFLLIASLIYYRYKNSFLLLLIISVVLNYLLHYFINYFDKKKSITLKKVLLFSGIVLNLSLLFYFKYYNFAIDTINILFKTNFTISDSTLPIGISFITFQQIAFLVDTYYKTIPSCNLLKYSLFTAYFPHISSGPIILYNNFVPQLSYDKKEVDWDKIAMGIYIFIMGLGKKVLIADMLAKAADWGYANPMELNTTTALFVSIAYSLQIYFDFSGYSDMAIGISRILQLDLPVNFNSPYKAETILDFWDRWHITLTQFLTRYLYIPLGGNRKGKVRTYLNILIVFLCSGLWHGASWTFVAWGALHGIFMVFTRFFYDYIKSIPKIVNRVITLLFVNFTWILFRSNSFTVFKQMMGAILQNKWGPLNEELCNLCKPYLAEKITVVELPYWLWTVAVLIVIVFLTLKCQNVYERAKNLKYLPLTMIWVLAVAILSILSLSGITTFIYSNF